ncbi:potassium channel family protein [Thioalkalivibrio sp. AKL19]|uniref:potassium channel family protein n=1 Tax=Thioalkalivibrio sp. AKL19 TaxID=1266914 RepID=UPI0009DBD1C4
MAYISWSWGICSVEGLCRIDSIYHSFVTMTTLGYGDIFPVSDLTKMLATGQTLVGMFMFEIVIGLFLSKSNQGH